MYPNEGDWPIALSILPFLAQGRALYIVLVHHKATPDVNHSLLLLFAFGTITLLIAFAIDERGSIFPYIMKQIRQYSVARHTTTSVGTSKRDDANNAVNLSEAVGGKDIESAQTLIPQVDPDRASLAPGAVVVTHQLRLDLDMDLNAEREKAVEYVEHKESAVAVSEGRTVHPRSMAYRGEVKSAGGAASAGEPLLSRDEYSRLAIVLQGMHFEFPPNDTVHAFAHMVQQRLTRSSAAAVAARKADAEVVWAVNDISLALSLGECFGLLGPNGAGKLISLLLAQDCEFWLCLCRVYLYVYLIIQQGNRRPYPF